MFEWGEKQLYMIGLHTKKNVQWYSCIQYKERLICVAT